jgi:uncharacterized protein
MQIFYSSLLTEYTDDAIEHRVFVVVYTIRSDAIRIISARKANQKEVTDYEDCAGDD